MDYTSKTTLLVYILKCTTLAFFSFIVLICLKIDLKFAPLIFLLYCTGGLFACVLCLLQRELYRKFQLVAKMAIFCIREAKNHILR